MAFGRAGHTVVLGHRGCSGEASENTLPAFAAALARGAMGVECDVRLDGSGEPIIFHDADLARMTGGTVTAEVGQLTSGDRSRIALKGGESIPTLSELLDWANRTGALLNLELKGEEEAEALLDAVVRELERARLPIEQLVLSCFEYQLAQQMRSVLPRHAVALICTGRTDLVGQWIRDNAVRQGSWLVNAWLDTLDVGLAEEVRAAGGELGIWGADTADDLPRLASLLTMGVEPALVIGDEPWLLLEPLRQPQPRPQKS